MDKCDEVDVVMMSSGSYDFISLKKVDRLRMKRFKQLPEKHKKAFEKGIFKTDMACYTQEFIPHYKKKQSDIKTKKLFKREYDGLANSANATRDLAENNQRRSKNAK